MSLYSKSSHKSVARGVGFALTLLSEGAMWSLAAILRARLQPGERRFLAASAMLALDENEYQAVIDYLEGPA